MMADAKDEKSTQDGAISYKLDADSELRFEVDHSSVQLELESGHAEIFGTELASNKKYTFTTGAKVAVFTFHGCTLTITGKTEVAYTAKETPMLMYLNTHTALEQLRCKADEESSRGPRVMVVGPTDVGKSTLCRLLVNYAARRGRAPVLVDLDVGQNDLSIPGTISGVVVERPADIEDGYSLVAPLVYHFGHKSPDANVQLYCALITQLADVISMRCESNSKTNISGVVINTCGWIHGKGFECIKHASAAFEVDLLIVLDTERLFSQLRREIPEFVKVILLPKSGGVVERTQKTRASRRLEKIKQYFYGLRNDLCPYTYVVRFSDVSIYKIGGAKLSSHMLPIGMANEDTSRKLVPVLPNESLTHHVLSVSMASSTDDDVAMTNVAGFIVVTSVDTDKQTFDILSPSPPPLPFNILLLMDDVTFME